MRVDGERVYRCQDCLDTGIVSVVAHKAIWKAIQAVRSGNVSRFGVSFESVYCHCDAGDFKLQSFAENRRWNEWRLNQYQCFNESQYHIHANDVLNHLECVKCGNSKTTHDWDIARDEMSNDSLRCRSCGYIWNNAEAKPDCEFVIAKVREIESGLVGDDILSSYTRGAL